MRDRRVAAAVAAWFRTSARDLPWRRPLPGTGRRDPYLALVSEFMLQQTQVARVLEKFEPFIRRFPSIHALAAAEDAAVLAAWTGLGYYRRARHLHAAAKRIAAEHAGSVPSDAAALRALPGVGRYTAGSIASICFGLPEPIVDGNVTRVLMRLNGRDEPPTGAGAVSRTWIEAAALVRAAARNGAEEISPFNEGLMELGATVCTPRGPRCGDCPVRRDCRARRGGRQDQIPPPRPRGDRREIHCATLILRDARGRLFLERRAEGLWAGLWQAPTLESAEAPAAAQVRAWSRALGAPRVREADRFEFLATHRRVWFAVYAAAPLEGARARRLIELRPEGRWVIRRDLGSYGLSSPQRRILSLPDSGPATILHDHRDRA